MKRCTLLSLLALICASLLLLNSCGGGGSSAINPGPNPTIIPTVNNGTISGTITNALDGQPIDKAQVKLNDQTVTTTGPDGKYSFSAVNNGRLTINGGALERSVPFNLTSPVKNISLIPIGFNTDNFWAYFKRTSGQIIRKWKNKPTEFIIYTHTIDSNKIISQDIINNISSIIKSDIYPLNNNWLNNLPIRIIEEQPQNDPNWIVHNEFGITKDSISITFLDSLLASGKAAYSFDNQGNLNGGGIVILPKEENMEKHLQRITNHELGHVLFYFYHPFENIENSAPTLMNYDSSVKTFTEYDKWVIGIINHRFTGTTYPDYDPDNSSDYSAKLNKTNIEVVEDIFPF